MRIINSITRMSRMGKEIKERVRAREEGLFSDTIIEDGDSAIGYDRNGKCYLIDADDMLKVGRFLWHRNADGFEVTDNVSDPSGRLMRMDEFIMGLWDV